MAPLQFIVEGSHPLSGSIRPSGNKNAALPIVAAALLTEQPVTLENVPRIRDVETLVLSSSDGKQFDGYASDTWENVMKQVRQDKAAVWNEAYDPGTLVVVPDE